MPHDAESEVLDICAALHELGAELSRKRQKSVYELEMQLLPAVEKNSLQRHYERIDVLPKEAREREPGLDFAAKTAAAPPLLSLKIPGVLTRRLEAKNKSKLDLGTSKFESGACDLPPKVSTKK